MNPTACIIIPVYHSLLTRKVYGLSHYKHFLNSCVRQNGQAVSFHIQKLQNKSTLKFCCYQSPLINHLPFQKSRVQQLRQANSSVKVCDSWLHFLFHSLTYKFLFVFLNFYYRFIYFISNHFNANCCMYIFLKQCEKSVLSYLLLQIIKYRTCLENVMSMCDILHVPSIA